VHYRCYISR